VYLPAVPYVIDPLLWAKLIQIGRREQVSAGIALMPQAFSTFMLAFATLFWNLPFALWVTGAGTSSGRRSIDWITGAYDLSLLRFSLARAAQVWAMSESLEEMILGWGADDSKIRVVPCQNIDANMFKRSSNGARIRAQLGIPVDEKVVTCIGRLYPLKGISYLLEASSVVLQAFPKTRFIVVGRGPQYGPLKASAEATAGDRFIFTDWVEPGQLHEILNTSDAFVLPSLSEGVPTVLLEAYAYEIPVVATDVGATKDILRDGVNGFLVPPRNSQMLAQAIMKLLRDDHLSQAMGKRNRDFVLRNFARTDEQMGELLLARLHEMIKENK
jgi:glycosyltransferase involved in cell wall biosynthesis